jgi:hypothetical protein
LLVEIGDFETMPLRTTGWSFLAEIFVGGAAVAIGSAKMFDDTMMGLEEEVNVGMRLVGESREVGCVIELVKMGCRVSRPLVSRLVWSEPVVSGFLSLRVGRIWTVPDGPTLVTTFAVEVFE